MNWLKEKWRWVRDKFLDLVDILPKPPWESVVLIAGVVIFAFLAIGLFWGVAILLLVLEKIAFTAFGLWGAVAFWSLLIGGLFLRPLSISWKILLCVAAATLGWVGWASVFGALATWDICSWVFNFIQDFSKIPDEVPVAMTT